MAPQNFLLRITYAWKKALWFSHGSTELSAPNYLCIKESTVISDGSTELSAPKYLRRKEGTVISHGSTELSAPKYLRLKQGTVIPWRLPRTFCSKILTPERKTLWFSDCSTELSAPNYLRMKEGTVILWWLHRTFCSAILTQERKHCDSLTAPQNFLPRITYAWKKALWFSDGATAAQERGEE